MATYNLYLDESETHTDGKDRFFSISGIIVEEKNHENILTPELNALKKDVWESLGANYEEFILHEKDIKAALLATPTEINNFRPQYQVFNKRGITKNFYIGLDKIINKNELWIIGACISKDQLFKNYSKDILNDQPLILLQIILENFCHFLEKKNGKGRIFYESVGAVADRQMSLRFHHIKAIGTMFVSPHAFQSLIKDLNFPNKKDNITGLQIADFIPNNVVRKAANKEKSEYNLYKCIEKKAYDGGIKRNKKYGIKQLS